MITYLIAESCCIGWVKKTNKTKQDCPKLCNAWTKKNIFGISIPIFDDEWWWWKFMCIFLLFETRSTDSKHFKLRILWYELIWTLIQQFLKTSNIEQRRGTYAQPTKNSCLWTTNVLHPLKTNTCSPFFRGPTSKGKDRLSPDIFQGTC